MIHDEIENVTFFEGGNGNICMVKKNCYDAAASRIAFGPRVAPEDAIITLLSAAPFMYQQLTLQTKALQNLITNIESLPGDNEKLITGLVSLQDGCFLAQSIAQNGIENVAKMLSAQEKVKKQK